MWNEDDERGTYLAIPFSSNERRNDTAPPYSSRISKSSSDSSTSSSSPAFGMGMVARSYALSFPLVLALVDFSSSVSLRFLAGR